jgi:hypothetical protein
MKALAAKLKFVSSNFMCGSNLVNLLGPRIKVSPGSLFYFGLAEF